MGTPPLPRRGIKGFPDALFNQNSTVVLLYIHIIGGLFKIILYPEKMPSENLTVGYIYIHLQQQYRIRYLVRNCNQRGNDRLLSG